MKLIKRIFSVLAIASILYFTLSLFIDFVRYPESYITTWKYQLQQDIKRGDSEAIQYYQRNYINNNRPLFE